MACFGIPFGLFLGSKASLYRDTELLIDFFRALPASALFPLFLLFFGIGGASKVMVAAFCSGLVVLFSTAHGVFHCNKARIVAVRLMGASRFQVFTGVVFWETLPHIFGAFRISIGLSLIIIIITEMFVGTAYGIGRRIIDAQTVFHTDEMYLWIVVAGIIGYFMNFLAARLEKRLIHWTGTG